MRLIDRWFINSGLPVTSLFKTGSSFRRRTQTAGETMRCILQIILWLALLLPTQQLLGAEQAGPPTVVVLPLEVSNEGTYAYLNQAINQMLLTRLSGAGGLKVLGSDLKPEQWRQIRSRLQAGEMQEAIAVVAADWFLDGSMYSLKDGLQINVSLYPTAEGTPLTLTVKADDQDGVIRAVSGLSKDIEDAIVLEKKTEEDLSEETDTGSGLSGFETPHPERDYRKGLYSGAALIAGGDGDLGFTSRGIRKSDPIPLDIVSLASGDLNGDGVNEVIIASRSKIMVLSFSDLKFQKVAEYDFSARMKIHVINIGDHDGSGRMKLYVSGNDGRYASSAIFGWDGSPSLQPIKKSIPWYLRPLQTTDGKTMLIGQQANDRQHENFLQPGVFELTIDPQDSKIVKGNRLLLPEGTNLFDFIQADLDGDKLNETVLIDKKQKLLVYDSASNLIWVSSANYGGSRTFFGPSRELTNQLDSSQLTEAQQDNRQLVWIPGRLDVKDLTGDGLPEIVVVTNDIGIDKYLENSRFYKGGSVACLSWSGYGLAEIWQTSHIDGYVADYFFDEGDTPENNGSDTVLSRLYVAQIPVVSFVKQLLPTSRESRVLAYEMMVKKSSTPAPKP